MTFMLSKATARVFVEFTKPKQKGPVAPGIYFQCNVKGRSQIAAADGWTLALRFDLPKDGEDFAVPAEVMAALYRAIPPKGFVSIAATAVGDDELDFSILTNGFTKVLTGTCPRDKEVVLAGHNLDKYAAGEPSTRWERLTGEEARLGVNPTLLSRLKVVLRATTERCVEWYINEPLDPIKFVIRQEDKELWRVLVMPMRIQ